MYTATFLWYNKFVLPPREKKNRGRESENKKFSLNEKIILPTNIRRRRRKIMLSKTFNVVKLNLRSIASFATNASQFPAFTFAIYLFSCVCLGGSRKVRVI